MIRSLSLLLSWFYWIAVLLGMSGLTGCALAESTRPPSPDLPRKSFPSAEGFGQSALGGLGGVVYEVTTLKDSGPGSLRECVEASGPRTCVFRSAGTIITETLLIVGSPYITIAGQTAPPPGITIRSAPKRDGAAMTVDTHDVNLRYIRLEAGPRSGAPSSSRDSLHMTRDARNVIVDHASMRFGADENITVNGCDVTIQWSVVAWGLAHAGHKKGAHSKGVLGANPHSDCGVSLNHNLIAHNRDRNPDLDFAKVQMVNNVIYNADSEFGEFRRGDGQLMRLDYIGNVVLAGPNTTGTIPHAVNLKPSGTGTFELYVKDNIDSFRPGGVGPEDLIVKEEDRRLLVPDPHTMPPVTTFPSAQVLDKVLADVGATLPSRDATDRVLIDHVRNLTGRIIDHPDEAHTWAVGRGGGRD